MTEGSDLVTLGTSGLARVLLASALLGCVACGSEAPSGGDDTVTVGLLLPFTGDESGTASNFERAALFARDQVNAGGGIKHHRLRLVSADTHSDASRAKESVQTLIDAGAVVIIGPESAEIAEGIKPILDAHDVVLLSPLVGAADDQAVDCEVPWFRLAPSAGALGEALAKLVIANGFHKSALLASDGEYDIALRAAFEKRFVPLGGEVAYRATLPRRAQTYASSVGGALTAGVDSVLLSTSPRAGALVVDEFGVLARQRPRWFLSPLLKTEVLLQNVAPEILERALGVAPRIYDTSDAFPSAFEARWEGDQPLEGAYFYYDAVALVAFGLERAAQVSGRFPVAGVRTAIFDAAGPPGAPSRWDEIPATLSRFRDGDAVFYTGLTGPMLLRPCGDRQVGASSTWQVSGGRIEALSDP
jgi:ABC-type branched-subunit amino acid transport system substrate-binding protein